MLQWVRSLRRWQRLALSLLLLVIAVSLIVTFPGVIDFLILLVVGIPATLLLVDVILRP